MSKLKKRKKTVWELHPVPQGMRHQHALPAELPVPRKEAERFDRGDIQHTELARWIEKYLAEGHEVQDQDSLLKVKDRLLKTHEAAEASAVGNREKAIELLTEIIAEEPKDYVSALNLASAQATVGDGAKAIEVLDRIEDQMGTSARYIIVRSRALRLVGRGDEGIELLKSSFEKGPGNLALQQELIQLRELIPTHLNPNDMGQTKFTKLEDYKAAVYKKRDEFIEKKDAEGLARVADFQMKGGFPEISLELAEKGIEVDPEYVSSYIAAAKAALSLGQLDQSENFAQKAVELDGNDLSAVCAVARAKYEKGEKEAAVSLLKDNLKDEVTHLETAELFILLHEGSEARLEASNHLKETAPDSWVVKKLLGDLAFAAGKNEEALQLHREAFEASDNDEALTMLLHDLDRADKLTEALELLQSLSRFHDRLPTTRWNAANVLLKANKIDPALRILDGMIKDPKLTPETRYSATKLFAEVKAATN